jgi:hypothetical protein
MTEHTKYLLEYIDISFDILCEQIDMSMPQVQEPNITPTSRPNIIAIIRALKNSLSSIISWKNSMRVKYAPMIREPGQKTQAMNAIKNSDLRAKTMIKNINDKINTYQKMLHTKG